MSTHHETRTAYALTKFPYLGSSANSVACAVPESCGPGFHERNFDIPSGCPYVTEERLTTAWAHLLRHYVSDDVVVFRANLRHFKVDFEAGTIQEVSGDTIENRGQGTAVFSQEVNK